MKTSATCSDALADQGNLNILCSKSVKGKVGVTLRNVDLDTALTAIIKSMGLASRREGKFHLRRHARRVHAMEQSVDKMGTRVYRPNYVAAAELEALIRPMLTEKGGSPQRFGAGRGSMAADGQSAGGNKFAGNEPSSCATTRRCSTRSINSWPRSTSARCKWPSKP